MYKEREEKRVRKPEIVKEEEERNDALSQNF